MTTKISGTSGIEFPDGTSQTGSADARIAFRAKPTASQTVTSGTPIQVTLSNEIYDTHNAFSNSAFTAPVKGIYHFDGAVRGNGTTMSQISAQLWVNGSAEATNTVVLSYQGSSSVSISEDLLLNAGDVVTLYGVVAGTGTILFDIPTTAGSSKFSGHLVRAA